MKLKLFTVAALLFALTSCGSKSEKNDNIDDADDKEMVDKDFGGVDDSDFDSAYTYDSENVGTTDDSDNDDSADATASASDVDDMLNEYEEFVNKYVSLAKKAAKGDMSAMKDYSSYMESAQSLGEKIQKCTANMNASQTKRYMDITNKMSKAASEIAGQASGAIENLPTSVNDAMEMYQNLDF